MANSMHSYPTVKLTRGGSPKSFQKQVAKLWIEAERLELFAWIAAKATAGDVTPGADGARMERVVCAGIVLATASEAMWE